MSGRSASSRQRFGLILAAGIVATGLQSRLSAQDSVVDSISREVRAVFEKSRGAVVKIQAIDEHGQLSGTGFFIDPTGTVYTSYTIGGESHDIIVLHDDQKSPAKRLLADSHSGIAILTIEKPSPYLPIGKSEDLAVASPVMTVGYPMDMPVTPSFGVVGGFDVKYSGRYFSTAHIRANVAVQRGEGGAPLLNLKGEAVGILISSLESGNGCFALPIEAAEKVRKDLMRFGEVRPGWLGITVKSASSAAGTEVDEVGSDAPAAKAGVQKGDVLLQVGPIPIKSPEDVLSASFYLTAGDEVPVLLLRDGEKLTLKVQAGTHPLAPRETVQAFSPEPLGGRAVRLKTEP